MEVFLLLALFATIKANFIAICLAPLAPTIAIVVQYFLSRRDRNAKADLQTKQNTEIHLLVNGRLTSALARIDTLENELGIEPGHKYIGPVPVGPQASVFTEPPVFPHS